MSVFEVIANNDEQALEADRRTVIAAQTRAKARFEKFIGNSANDSEILSRLALIDSNLRDLAREAAEEYGGDADRAYFAATSIFGCHADDCECGFCENQGSFGQSEDDEEEYEDDEEEYEDDEEEDEDDKEEDEDKEKESSVKTACSCGCYEEHCDCGPDCDGSCHTSAKLAKYHVATEVETGDHYQSETLDLGSTTSEDGVSSTGSPKIDKGNSGDHTGWDLDPIDVGSVRNKLEMQDVTKGADYNDPDFLKDKNSPIRDRVDVTKATNPQNSKSQSGTWTGTEGLADPVTEGNPVTSKLRNWTVVEG